MGLVDLPDYASAVMAIQGTDWTPDTLAGLRASALSHYEWDDGCFGWRVVDRPDLSVILEEMSPGTGEVGHVHRHSRQLFVVVVGVGVMELAGAHEVLLTAGSFFEVPPRTWHRLTNRSDAALGFFVVSSPRSRGDREPHARPDAR